MIKEEQILEYIKKGSNEPALAALYRHFPAIRRMIRYYGGNKEQAEDIFQEALIIFCRKAKDPAFKLSSGIYPYLHSVCRFLWKDENIRQQRTNAMPVEIDSEIIPEPELQDMVDTERKFSLAEKIITELADRCREILVLFYNGGFSLKDIALKMGYSTEQSAKNQKYKCLEAARNQFVREYQRSSIKPIR